MYIVTACRGNQTEKYSRLESADDSTDRTAVGNTTAANSNRAVAGDRTDGGRPSDTTAGRITTGFLGFLLSGGSTLGDGTGGGALCRGRRLGYIVGRVNTRARASGTVCGHDGTSFCCGCAGTACSVRIVVVTVRARVMGVVLGKADEGDSERE